MMLQGEWPFQDKKEDEAKELVKEGHRPSFYVDVWNSPDPVDQAIKQAMIMCHEQDPAERASAREVENFLKQKMHELDPGQLDGWGIA
jgi:hypothetical protein